MAVTPNFSWPVPVATDYVKDGWEAISDLGNAIDTTVAGLGSGLVKLNTTTFTTSSAVAIDGVFSSTYDNYKMLVKFTASSVANVDIRWYGRSGSPATDTTTLYYSQLVSGQDNSSGGAFFTTGKIGDVSNSHPTLCSIDAEILSPNIAETTKILVKTGYWTNAGALVSRTGASWQQSSTQFTGIKLYPDSGTVSGTITIYGYEK